MECNKDEAVRSKHIAEEKFVQHDIVGAKKFALKARQLFPELEGLPQLIAVLDVHLVAQDKLNGVETNWYGLLQVDSTADEATIRKQYRKLALLLHPDKNKAIGAEAAFKLIAEAWRVLSDNAKKAAHDMKRNASVSHNAKFTKRKTPPSTTNGFHPQRPAPPIPQPPPNHQASSRSPTFWTACTYCKMQYEYLRMYENQNLACPTCHKPFVAREVHVVGLNGWWHPSTEQGFRVNTAGAHVNGFYSKNSFANANFPWGSSGSASMGRTTTSRMVQQTFEKVRSERFEAKRESNRKGKRDEKKVEEDLKRKAMEAAKAKEAFDKLMARWKASVSSDQAGASELKVKSEQAPTLEKLEVKKNQEKLSSLNGQGQTSADETDGSKRVPSEKVGVPGQAMPKLFSQRTGDLQNGSAIDDSNHEDFLPSKKIRALNELRDGEKRNSVKAFGMPLDEFTATVNHMGQKCEDMKERTDSKMKGNGTPASEHHSVADDTGIVPGKCEINSVNPSVASSDAIDVPDPDFYDFDKDRTESHFKVGQIWAIYDDDDGMPRYYARINKIICLQPFRVQMSWLEPRYPSKETIAGNESGITYTCGEFRIGKAAHSECVNTFSHSMPFEKVQRGAIKIYPRRGDVWALYKGSRGAQGLVLCEFEMVEVLTDFQEKVGVTITLLTKIKGFKTLFMTQGGAQAMQCISSNDLLRFSHFVPAYRLTSHEVPGLAENCWELDPAATPMELIIGGSTK